MSKLKGEINKECGVRLREVLMGQNRKQKEIASDIGYTPQQINYLISGARRMTLENASLLADVLKIRKEYLLCEDNFKTQKEKRDYEAKQNMDTDHLFWSYLEHIGFELTLFNLDKDIKQKLLPTDRISNMYIGNITTPTGEKKEMNFTRFLELQEEINDYIIFKFNRE